MADSRKIFSSLTVYYQVIIIDLTQSTINSSPPANTAPVSTAQSWLISVSHSWCVFAAVDGHWRDFFPAQPRTVILLKIPRTSAATGQLANKLTNLSICLCVYFIVVSIYT